MNERDHRIGPITYLDASWVPQDNGLLKFRKDSKRSLYHINPRPTAKPANVLNSPGHCRKGENEQDGRPQARTRTTHRAGSSVFDQVGGGSAKVWPRTFCRHSASSFSSLCHRAMARIWVRRGLVGELLARNARRVICVDSLSTSWISVNVKRRRTA